MTAETPQKPGLDGAYSLESSTAAQQHYNLWAADYDDELISNGYITPRRCAQALADAVTDITAPLIEFGCGTGLGGAALRDAGFTTIDGFDLSEEMLTRAMAKGLYRTLGTIDLAEPLQIANASYANAAAIGVVNPRYMPVTVIDEMLRVLPSGGCLVFSLNDHSAADGGVMGRVLELTDTCAADLLLAEDGEHIPGTGLRATVFVLRKR